MGEVFSGFSIWVVLDNPKKCWKRAFCQKSAALCHGFWQMRHFPKNFCILLLICTSRSSIWTVTARFTLVNALALAIRPWIVPFHLTFVLRVRTALKLDECCIVLSASCIAASSEDAPHILTQFWGSYLRPSIYLFNASVLETAWHWSKAFWNTAL